MPRNMIRATADWQLLTTSDVTGRLTIQTRGWGRLYVARGTAAVPPSPEEGLYFDRSESSGAGDVTLDALDPGVTGARLWVRVQGADCDVWCSWVDTP